MTANPTESFSRNLSNFPKVTTTFPSVGTEETILPKIVKYTTAALAVEVAVLSQGRGYSLSYLVCYMHNISSELYAQQCQYT